MPARPAIRYRLELAVDARTWRVAGRWRMHIERDDAARDLVLDWRGESASALSVNGTRADGRVDGSRLVIPAAALRPGPNTLEMRIAAPIAASGTPVLRWQDGDDACVYSLFVPAEASALFPCIDRPDARARFRLALALPPGWTAVSCMPAARLPDGRIAFGWTPPLPTYAFAFAAGPFAAIEAPPGAPPATAWVRRGEVARLREDALEALRLMRTATAWGERYFAHPFPFSKHDLVLLPAFPFGGMEHAGATFLDEDAIAIGPDAREGARRRRAQLVFHETVHQWLGDSVTIRTFGDLWLKEGYANLGASLCAEAADASLRAPLALHRLKCAAVRQDLGAGARPVRCDLPHAREAKSLYGPAVYGKAPAVLAQVRHLVGAAAFDAATRALVRDHALDAADADDLGRALAGASGRPMQAWLRAWLEQSGSPVYALRVETGRGRVARAYIETPGTLWPVQRVEAIALGSDGATHRASVLLDRPLVEIDAWHGQLAPRIAFANAGDHGYGRFVLDPASREAALAGLAGVADPLLRLQLVESLWDDVREATLDPARFLSFALAQLEREAEWAVAAALAEHASIAAQRYVGDAAGAVARAPLDAAKRRLGLARAVPRDPACLALAERAGRADAAQKSRCFNALLHETSLSERCVEAAAERFNAVEHAPLTLPFLRPALEALPRLAHERRIFFVDRWLAAFVGGQVGRAALAEVERVLAETPLDADLRRKVREHADELARTVRIRARYAVAAS
jgi:aminopeptidase N